MLQLPAPPRRRWAAARGIGRDVAMMMLGAVLVLSGVMLGVALADRIGTISPPSGPEAAHTVPALPPELP